MIQRYCILFSYANSWKVGISSGNQALTRCAFLGTNPKGGLITSGLPVTRHLRLGALDEGFSGL